MKKIIKILIIINIFVTINVYAASNPYKQYSSFGLNCTWDAWNQAYNRLGIALPGWGNAKDWYNDAKNSGYSVGSTPKANSIVVWDNFETYGHVAFVDHVEGSDIYYWDSQVCYREMTEEEYAVYWDCIVNETVSEEDAYKCDHLKIQERIPCRKSGVVGDDKLIGYIYITEKTNNPVPPTNNNSNNTANNKKTENTTVKKEETKKSSNNNLKTLSIKGIEFEFAKDILEYNLEVENEVDKVVIEGTLEDNKAKAEGFGEQLLEVGENVFTIKITSEDNSVKEYNIIIKRKEKLSQKDIKQKEIKKVTNNKKWLKIGIGVAIILIIFVIGIIFLIYKKKQKKLVKNN